MKAIIISTIATLLSLSLRGQAPAPQGQPPCCAPCAQQCAPAQPAPTVKYVGSTQAQIREAVREEIKAAMPAPQPAPQPQPIVVNPPAINITAPQPVETDLDKAMRMYFMQKFTEERQPAVPQPVVAPTVNIDVSGIEKRIDRSNQLQEIQNGYVRSINTWTRVTAVTTGVGAAAGIVGDVELHGVNKNLKKLTNSVNGLGNSVGQALTLGQSSIATAIANIKPPTVTVEQTSTQTGASSSSTSTSSPTTTTTVTANPTSSSVSSPTVTSSSSSNPTVNNTNAGNGGQGGQGGQGGTGGTASAQGGTASSTGGTSSSIGSQTSTTNNSTTNNNTTVVNPVIPPCGCD